MVTTMLITNYLEVMMLFYFLFSLVTSKKFLNLDKLGECLTRFNSLINQMNNQLGTSQIQQNQSNQQLSQQMKLNKPFPETQPNQQYSNFQQMQPNQQYQPFQQNPPQQFSGKEFNGATINGK